MNYKIYLLIIIAMCFVAGKTTTNDISMSWNIFGMIIAVISTLKIVWDD